MSEIATAEQYRTTAEVLADRVLRSVPRERLLAMTSPWDLFKVEGFNCDDLNPSLCQAQWALDAAKQAARSSA